MPGIWHSSGEFMSKPGDAEVYRTEGGNDGETICERASNPIRFCRCTSSFTKQSKFR